MLDLVLGEDTLENISTDRRDVLDKTIVHPRDFILAGLLQEWDKPDNRNEDDLYAMFVREIDRIFEEDILVLDGSDSINGFFYRHNISVLLYEVEFDAGGTGVLTVTCPLRATIDREKSDHYVNSFVYLLNPARNFPLSAASTSASN